MYNGPKSFEIIMGPTNNSKLEKQNKKVKNRYFSNVQLMFLHQLGTYINGSQWNLKLLKRNSRYCINICNTEAVWIFQVQTISACSKLNEDLGIKK